MVITRKDLVNYHLLESMIGKNEKKLEMYRNNEPCVSVGKVYGSSEGFPFIQCGFTVGGADQEEYRKWKEWDAKCRYLEIKIKQDLQRMIDLKLAIDELITGIVDIEDKMILEYTMNGKSQQWIANKLNMGQSCVSKRIEKYLK